MVCGVFTEWRSGVAGHLILSDEDLTSVVQGNWKRLNTLQHYKVHTDLRRPRIAPRVKLRKIASEGVGVSMILHVLV